MKYRGVIGGHAADSPLSEQTCINLMTAPVEDGPEGRKALVNAPGLGSIGYYFTASPYTPTGPVYAVFSHNVGTSYAPYSFAVIGKDLWCHEWGGHNSYRIGEMANAVATSTGAHVANDGSQLFITNGSDLGYIFPWTELAGDMYGPHGVWAASTAYSSATPDTVLSSARGYHHIYFECTTSGTSGGTEPTWDYTVGNTTNDGTVVWTARARLQPITDTNMTGMTLHSAQFIGGYFVAVDSSSGIGKFVASYHTGLVGVSVTAFLGASGLAWSTADAGKDDIVTLAVAQNRLWIFGTDTLEQWQLSGGAKFPFSRVASARYGCESIFSVAVYEDIIFWRGRDSAYRGAVFMADGGGVRRISTKYLEQAIDETVAACAYRWKGQTFYMLTLGAIGSTSGETYVYSAETGDWYRWGGYQDGAYRSSTIQCAGEWYNGTVALGDNSYLVWQPSESSGHDGSSPWPLRRERIFPEIGDGASMTQHRGLDLVGRLNQSFSTDIWLTTWAASTAYTVEWVEPTTPNGWSYVLETAGTSGASEPTWPTTLGAKVTDGTCVWVAIPTNPLFWLDWSDDNGANWSSAREGNLGDTSDTYTLLRFRGLGAARRRIYRFVTAGYSKVYLLGADIDLAPGRN